MHAFRIAFILSPFALTGCASIVAGTNQPVSVETRAAGAVIAGAACKLSNDKGVWFVTTPGSTMVHRSADDLAVRCEKKGYEPGIASAKSSTKGMAFGNILFGGLVGGAIDVSSGAAFDYPSLINVEMSHSETLVSAPAKNQDN